MAYTPTTWANGVTPINAGNLNKMEQGIKRAHEDVREVSVGGTGKNTHSLNSVLIGNGTNPVNNIATADGAFYAVAENEEPVFGVLPIGQGGTGKKNAADALAALGGTSKKLLWRGTSLTSVFTAQVFKDELAALPDNYDEIEFVMKSSTGSDYYYKFSVKIGTTKRPLALAASEFKMCTREITVSKTSISFGNAYYVGSYASGSESNYYLVPYEIYGIKGVQ